MNTRRLVACPHCDNFVRLAANPIETTCPFCGDGVCVEDGCASGHGAQRRLGVRVTRLLLGPAAATVLAACYGLPEEYYPYDAEYDVPVDGDAGDASDADTDGSGEAPDAATDAEGSGEAPDAATDAGSDAEGSGETPDAGADAEGSGESPDGG